MNSLRSSVVELTESTTAGYLQERGVIPRGVPTMGESLGGGISNRVIRVTWDGGCLVAKQPLPRLRVEADWAFSLDRAEVEERCMRYLGHILPPGSVPKVLYSDRTDHVFAMTCAPGGGEVWKDALLRGEIDESTAVRAGSLLALLHCRAADDPQAREYFDDQAVLVQGRIDPYHRTASTRHPALAQAIDEEVARLLATRESLVLGDYSPKNVIVYADRLLILDFEVAHWGDPAFDTAFCLTHLVLKACRLPKLADAYLAVAAAFWNAYWEAGGSRFDAVERHTVTELGCLLLARIDGKSAIEYISDESRKGLVRALAVEFLAAGSPTSISDALTIAEGRIAGIGAAS